MPSATDILHRRERSPYSTLTPLQFQVDGMVAGFAEQATGWRSLTAMTAGGMAYRVGRVGVMGLGSGNMVRALSVGTGLTAEVSSFELTHRSLHSLHPENSNLWRWSGSGGIRQGLLQSFIAFGALKGLGRLARGENVIVQHLLQDSAMVMGYQTSGIFGIAPAPTGTLAEQFLRAEATNLQLGAGMALAHRAFPGIHGLERGLDLSFRGTEIPPTSLQGARGDFGFSRPAFAATGLRSSPSAEHELRGRLIFTMGAPKDKAPAEIPQTAGTGESGERPGVRHLAIALFLRFIQNNGHSLEELEQVVSKDELNRLAQLPGSPMLPKGEALQNALMGQTGITHGLNLRQQFDYWRGLLGDLHLLGRVFAGISGNLAYAALSNLEYIRSERPEETLERLAEPKRDDLNRDLEEARQDSFKALRILGELYRILGETQSGSLLRGAFIGKSQFGDKGIRFHYRRFESEVLNGLPPDVSSQLGLESVPSYRELMLRTWRLTRMNRGS